MGRLEKRKRAASDEDNGLRKFSKKDLEALYRTDDKAKLEEALKFLESQIAQNRSGTWGREEVERETKRVQTLKLRLVQLNEKESRQARRREAYDKGGLALQKHAPRVLPEKEESALVGAQYVVIDGRQVLVGGSSNIPLPSKATLKAPPPPSWPPAPAKRIPSPPPLPPSGTPGPPLRRIPHPPRRDQRAPRPQPEVTLHGGAEARASTPYAPASPRQDQHAAPKAPSGGPVRAVVDLGKLQDQLKRGS